MSKLGFLIVPLIIAHILLASAYAVSDTHEQSGKPSRIVSLSPGITETLYALGLGDRVAAVTEFCNWPPETAQKPRVAGFRDINLEAIVRALPDLVILPEDMGHFRPLIENLNIPVITFDGRTLAGYLRDLEKIGQVCGVSEKARQLAAGFKKATRVNDENTSPARPRALFIIMNPDECNRPISEVNVIGNDGFYNELLKIAGAQNAYTGKLTFPRVSKEAILALKPDLVVVSAPEWNDTASLSKIWNDVNKDWSLENSNLLFLTDPGDTIPGPRALGALEKLEKAVGRLEKKGH